ncbi:MAG: YndJ family transporter, partial [Myxococcales bacterium]|nr:YndJ family transporter [Myxococcales bacterium]
MRTESLLWSNAIFGISLGVLLRFAHGPGAEPVARILTLGVLGIVPLALLVAPSVGPTWDRLRTWTAWALPLAGVSAVVSLWLDPPRGAPWVAPWMAACLLVASLGVV